MSRYITRKAEDEEEDAEQEEEDDFDWAKYDKEYLEREAKKAQSSKQEKV